MLDPMEICENCGGRCDDTADLCQACWDEANPPEVEEIDEEDEGPYCIVRFAFDTPGGTIQKIGLTLEEAQAHCQDPSTSGDGWFDGYDLESERPSAMAQYRLEHELAE